MSSSGSGMLLSAVCPRQDPRCFHPTRPGRSASPGPWVLVRACRPMPLDAPLHGSMAAAHPLVGVASACPASGMISSPADAIRHGAATRPQPLRQNSRTAIKTHLMPYRPSFSPDAGYTGSDRRIDPYRVWHPPKAVQPKSREPHAPQCTTPGLDCDQRQRRAFLEQRGYRPLRPVGRELQPLHQFRLEQERDLLQWPAARSWATMRAIRPRAASAAAPAPRPETSRGAFRRLPPGR